MPFDATRYSFEHMTEDVAMAEAVTIDRDRRVIGDLGVEIEPAEPSVGEVQFDLLHSHRSNRIPSNSPRSASDHQLRVNPRAANVAIEWRKLRAQISQHSRQQQAIYRLLTRFAQRADMRFNAVIGPATHGGFSLSIS
jgi:hypothetical protein